MRAVRATPAELVNTVSDPTSAPPDWLPMAAADRLHQQLNGLIEVRANAAMVARASALPMGVRSTAISINRPSTPAIARCYPQPGLRRGRRQRACARQKYRPRRGNG